MKNILFSLFLLGVYSCGTEETSVLKVGGDGLVTIGNVLRTSLSLSWTKASDPETSTENLEYKVVYSNSDNISTVGAIETATGHTVVKDWTKDINSENVTGLDGETQYYFAVLVRDEDENTEIYTGNKITSVIDKIYLYATGATENGNIQGDYPTAREGADAVCIDTKPTGLDCSNIRAFISISDTDEIRDIPTNYDLKTSIPITNEEGYSATNTALADDWDDLLDGTVDNSLNDLGIIVGNTKAPAEQWWSGSNLDGSLNSNHCSTWTDDLPAVPTGMTGFNSSTNSYWITYTPGLQCSDLINLLCVCW